MITHIVSDWLFSPCCVEHQDEFIFERVAVAYSRDYNEVGRAQIKQQMHISLKQKSLVFNDSRRIFWSGHKVIKLFSYFSQLSMTFISKINDLL